MAENSPIEWTDDSWNPIRARDLATGKVGWHCVHVSEGCRRCYAESFNRRLGTGHDYKPVMTRSTIEVFLDETMLLKPLSQKRGRRIFVGSMTDIFADFVTDEMLDQVFAVMALSPQHTFQVLTKRPERMRAYVTAAVDGERGISREAHIIRHGPITSPVTHMDCIWTGEPLPNVWLGVSAEDQGRADERVPHLLATPAAVRFVSLEPLLGPIDLNHAGMKWNGKLDRQTGERRFLDWVIAGGESGPGARPMHPDWPRQIRDACAAAGVPFFFKQWGAWKEAFHDQDGPAVEEVDIGSDEAEAYLAGIRHPGWLKADGQFFRSLKDVPDDTPARLMERVGKKAAGRQLDGRTHDAMPGSLAA